MNNYFVYQQEQLYAEGVSLLNIAQTVKTPCYVYSTRGVLTQWRAFDQALGHFPHTICYAVKANSNLAILQALAKLGSGFDIVSIGELERVLLAGGKASNIVFSGVGKRPDELARALKENIRCFNIESESEMLQLHKIAQHLNKKAPIALRINPNIDANSHPYISTGGKDNKFGIASDEAVALYQTASTLPHFDIQGIACHVGSQLMSLEPILLSAQHLLSLAQQLKALGIHLRHIDVGGGLGVCYQHETPPSITSYADALINLCQDSKFSLIIEPGRSIVAEAGVLLTQVLYLKRANHKNFCIVDCAMNDLIRPALYNAWHNILPLTQSSQHTPTMYDIVGPVCESSDFLAKDRTLNIQEGDYLAIMTTGAYGFANSSNYNSRPRPAEVLVSDERYQIVRERETLAVLTELEHF